MRVFIIFPRGGGYNCLHSSRSWRSLRSCSLRSLVGLIAFLFACAANCVLADAVPLSPPSDAFADGIDRTDPNFVKASLLVMSPGDELYSCAGHSCIRLECPKFNLDYCFSYESESVKDKIFTFFMGKLKMGMFAIPTADYLKLGRESGRGVMQYTLNLPPDAKQRLWKILDERVAQGAYLPYDYMARSCAQSALNVLTEALAPYQLVVDTWPEKFMTWTRREFVDAAVQAYPWNKFFLYSIVGAECDRTVPKSQKAFVPRDLLAMLRQAKVAGVTLIEGDGEELLPVRHEVKSCVVTPFVVSCMAAALAAANWFLKVKWLDWLFLAFQSLAGAFFTYLVAFSNLPATSWNWLIVPFNLLPLALWKWRAKWALWFAGVLVLWEVGMIAYPHRLTDPAYLVLVGAYALMYARIGWLGRACRTPLATLLRSACFARRISATTEGRVALVATA